MRDRAVRRRRGVLLALVALSLVLLTAYFGESGGGALHAVQRTASEILSPVQEGATRALKPFRDLFGWFGDTFNAKDERDRLRKERDALLRENTQLQVANRAFGQLQKIYEANTAGNLNAYQPVMARVITRSPSLWYSTMGVDKGSADGVRADQPVVAGPALVGKIRTVGPHNALVELITDEGFGVSATAAASGEPGTILPAAVGGPGDLLFELVPHGKLVRQDERIVTAGTTASPNPLPSLFPPGILIGTVTRIDLGQGALDRRIHVGPAADLRRLSFVEVLTKPGTGYRAQVAP